VLKVFVDKNRDKRGVTADLSQFLAAIVAKKKRARQARFEKKSVNFINYTKESRAKTQNRKVFCGLFFPQIKQIFSDVLISSSRLNHSWKFVLIRGS